MATVLKEKYATADSVNRKIEILKRVEVITLILTGEHTHSAFEEVSIMEVLPI